MSGSEIFPPCKDDAIKLLFRYEKKHLYFLSCQIRDGSALTYQSHRSQVNFYISLILVRFMIIF